EQTVALAPVPPAGVRLDRRPKQLVVAGQDPTPALTQGAGLHGRALHVSEEESDLANRRTAWRSHAIRIGARTEVALLPPAGADAGAGRQCKQPRMSRIVTWATAAASSDDEPREHRRSFRPARGAMTTTWTTAPAVSPPDAITH